MRVLPILLFIIFLDWYLYDAIQTLMADQSTGFRTAVQVFFWSIPLLVLLLLSVTTKMQGSEVRKRQARIAGFTLSLIYFCKILMAGVLVLDDVGRLVSAMYQEVMGQMHLKNGRSPVMAKLGLGLGIIPLVILGYGMLRNKYRYRIHRQTVKIPNLPESMQGLKIVQLSDIHAGSFTAKDPVAAGVQMVLDEKPDLVFFTGDLVNTLAKEIDPYVSIFKKIKAKYGVYSIMGNHDYGDYVRWSDIDDKRANRLELEAAHAALGWQLLNNENQILDINGATLGIIGVENYSAKGQFSQYGDLQEAYNGVEGADVKICLSHDPSHWSHEIVKAYPDIQLTLSGHTHGGQFGLEWMDRFKWSPVQYVYPHWAGLYQMGKQYLYVNRGFGFLGYPGRVGILPEITVIELQSEV